MSVDADRMRLLEDGLDRIGQLALEAWFDGTHTPGEVVEEAVLICEEITEAPPPTEDDDEPEVDYSEIEAALPETWCPDLPLAERIRNLVKVRRTFVKAQKLQEERIAELELKTAELGDPPLAVDPWAVVKMRKMLSNNPRSIILNGKLIKLLQHVFGIEHGPQVVQPTKACPNCAGLGKVGRKMCVKCDGHAVIPDVDGMALRNASLELEVRELRECIRKGNAMMLCMARNDRRAPLGAWEDFERALGDYRNNGFEYSDDPIDFTEPAPYPVNAPELLYETE
jgi:hypothetical protein